MDVCTSRVRSPKAVNATLAVEVSCLPVSLPAPGLAMDLIDKQHFDFAEL